MHPIDTKYPRPDRKPKLGCKGVDYFKDIGTGRAETVFDDGRPIVIEYWFDVDTQLDFVTAFYSTLDIEAWDSDRHLG